MEFLILVVVVLGAAYLFRNEILAWWASRK